MARPKKNNYRHKRRIVLAENYRKRYDNWRNREPSKLRIFAWLRWKSEKPMKPKWYKEMEVGWWY